MPNELFVNSHIEKILSKIRIAREFTHADYLFRFPSSTKVIEQMRSLLSDESLLVGHPDQTSEDICEAGENMELKRVPIIISERCSVAWKFIMVRIIRTKISIFGKIDRIISLC